MKLAFFFLFFLTCGIAVAWFEGPDLIRDVQLQRAGFVPAEGARVVTAYCRPAEMIFSKCRVMAELPGQARLVSFEFTGMGGLVGRQDATMVRSATHPEIISTSLHLENLTRRMIAIGGLLAGIGWLLVVGVRAQLESPSRAFLRKVKSAASD